MSIEKVKAYFKKHGLHDRIHEVTESTATVEEAARALKCEPERIAKTLSFQVGDQVTLVVTAGDAKIDNKKFKDCFGVKAKMLNHEDAFSLIGHAVGGVCPFVVNEGVVVVLDESLKRFQTVFPAAGSASSGIELSIDELELHSNSVKWVDVCKGWNDVSTDIFKTN